MIRAQSLSKAYGGFLAVRDLSFEIRKGEVVGFLGKNGAGKTTTMRMLAGSIAIGAGMAEIGGMNVSEHPKKVKSMVGYLPESPPLYPDMTVSRYLHFCARMRDVSDVSAAVARVIQQTGLDAVQGRIIGNLSKGYKQRVGIAQALVHEPSVLILDEPVSGLDPTQRRDIRNLLQELAEGDTTVLLSTHVLSEIEAICSRVLIIDEGQLVEDTTLAGLATQTKKVTVTVTRPAPELAEALAAIEGVLRVQAHDNGSYDVVMDKDLREAIAAVVIPYGLVELRAPQALEEAFVRITEQDS